MAAAGLSFAFADHPVHRSHAEDVSPSSPSSSSSLVENIFSGAINGWWGYLLLAAVSSGSSELPEVGHLIVLLPSLASLVSGWMTV